MRKIDMKRILGGLAFFLTFSGAAWADASCATNPGLIGSCGPATRYTITLLEGALCRDAACASAYTVGSGAKTFDIASVAVGSAIGSFANFDNVPAGTYTHMRSVISNSFGMTAAAVSTCAAVNATMTLPNGIGGGFNGASDAITVANIAGVTWKDGAKTQIQMITALATPVTIAPGAKPPTVSIKFGTSSAMGCYTGGGFPNTSLPQAPQVQVVVSATP